MNHFLGDGERVALAARMNNPDADVIENIEEMPVQATVSAGYDPSAQEVRAYYLEQMKALNTEREAFEREKVAFAQKDTRLDELAQEIKTLLKERDDAREGEANATLRAADLSQEIATLKAALAETEKQARQTAEALEASKAELAEAQEKAASEKPSGKK